MLNSSYVPTPCAEALRDDPPNTPWKVYARERGLDNRTFNKVRAIKELRDYRGLPLKDAKDTVEEYFRVFYATGETYVKPARASRSLDLPTGGKLELVTEGGKTSISFNFDFGEFAVENELVAVAILSQRLASTARSLRQFKAKA